MADLNKPAGGAGDFLDQSEIDRLLAQAVEEPKHTIFSSKGRRQEASDKLKVETYDFRNPVFLTEIELRRLRLLHEDFIRYLTARMSLFLRMEFNLKMSKLTTVSYQKFIESLPSPTHICLFKAEPLAGVGILDINPRLALTIVDRMLGGRGHSVKSERYLTEIEIALIEDILMIVLHEWCGQWKSEQELAPAIIGHENNGRFLQTSPKNAIVLALAMEVGFGDCSEQLQIGVPYYTIEPIVKKMQARRQRDTEVARVEKRSAWRPMYGHITVPLRAEVEACELSLREIAGLRVGDVIQLPGQKLDDVRVILAQTTKFAGKVGIEGEHVAVELTQKLSPEESNVPAPATPHGR